MPVTIKLSKPLTGHAGVIREVTLRDPTFADLRAVGSEPTTVVWTTGGGGFVQVNHEAIALFADRLITDPNVSAQIENLSLRDALAIKDAVIGFFQQGEEGTGETSSSPTNSSSPSDGTPPASRG